MPRKPANRPARKPGPKPIELDPRTVEGLGLIDATHEECAAVLGVSRDTFERRLADTPELAAAYKKGQANGKISLRRSQWRVAESGNVAMLIWLGKQRLGQRDVQRMDIAGHDGGPNDLASGLQRLIERKRTDGHADA